MEGYWKSIGILPGDGRGSQGFATRAYQEIGNHRTLSHLD